jgi:pimeloyl-ACP methyl ester carboxylesterase
MAVKRWMWIAGGGAAVVLLLWLLVYFVFPEQVTDAFISLGRSDASLTRKQVNIGDHDVVYLEGGSGAPVVLLHGFGTDKDTWLTFAKHLTPQHRVVIPDIPGFGESSTFVWAKYGISLQVKRIDAFVKKIGLKRFHLVGSSMGATIAGVYAATHPDTPLSLTLMAAGGIKAPRESKYFQMLRSGSNPLVIKSVRDWDQLMKLAFVNPPRVPGLVKRVMAERAVKRRKLNQKIFMEILAEGHLLQEMLGEISAPTLIVWGDRDAVLDASAVNVLQEGIADYETVLIKKCGHLPYLELPRQTSRSLLSFLAKHSKEGR